ncbi:MAG: hypothetical protein J5883_06245 [Clostridiales bacterium]|nr:hypothetical protein [Clostridiales bacterium]
MDLTTLLKDSFIYLSRFDYDHYPEDFESFLSNLKELEEIDPSLIFQERKSLPKTAVDDYKKVIALYLCPALKKLDKAGTAEEINRQWNETFPKDKFYISDFESILKGFDANLLGLPLRKSKKRYGSGNRT